MFNKGKEKLLVLTVLALMAKVNIGFAADAGMAIVDTADLPINVANTVADKKEVTNKDAQAHLVSPTKAQTGTVTTTAPQMLQEGNKTLPEQAQPAQAQPASTPATASAEGGVTAPAPAAIDNDFSFDLKMKSINAPQGIQPKVTTNSNEQKSLTQPQKAVITDADLPKEIEYKVDTMENLGNSILSQMDGDLFSQMSEIEKSTTLLTLELRREKLRNEIEAQKAIRQRGIDDLERQKAEAKLKEFEKKKQIEANVLKEKQVLLDKEKFFEILKQRKLLNAYMNQMLINEQEWLKEKEALYAQLAQAEEEKKELVAMFKVRIDKVLDASQKNIQAAETAKANFERIVKGLKARNEQLRKRVEADAKIIKNAKNSLYLKSQSIEELKNKNASLGTVASANAAASAVIAETEVVEKDEEPEPKLKLSSQYAILGITGRAGVMSIDVIDTKGQPMSLKVGSPLPTGHVLSEIGSDYAKFSRDGGDDYLYVGKTIDGVIPTLGLTDNKNK